MEKIDSWQEQARKIWATLDRITKQQQEFVKDMQKLQRAQAKTDEHINKLSAEINKVSADISKLKENVDGIAKGFGRITIGMTLPCVEKAFKVVGIEVYGTEERVKRRDKKLGEEIEIDILTSASKEDKELIIAIDCVTYLRKDDIEMLFKKLDKFYHFFHEYCDKELIGAIAYVHGEKEAIHFAQTKKFYIISIGDDTMELKNPQIIPRIYKYQKTS